MPISTEDSTETLAAELREARVTAGLTQREAAVLAKVDPQTISRWERGERRPSHGEAAHLIGLYRERVVPEMPRQSVARGTFDVSAVPRDHRIMIAEFELEAEKKGAPEYFMDYSRDALRNPDNVTRRRYGHDGKVLSAEEHRLSTEQIITKLRALLDSILTDPRRSE